MHSSLLRDVAGLLLKIALIVLCAVLIFSFVYGVHRVSSTDMSPAVKDGDLAFFYRLDKHSDIGDIVAVRYKDKVLLARVVATEGDEVDITEQGLMINGAIQREAGIHFDTTQFVDGVELPLTVGEGQLFLLGDHRPVATDSRVFGCVDEQDTLGKVMAIVRTRGA